MTELMSDKHLTPETFVDVLEGAPVDVSRRQHLSVCVECQQELAELTQTLQLVASSERVAEHVESTPAPIVRAPARRGRVVAVVAAAIVVSLVAYSLVSPVAAPPGSIETAELDEFLPPVDEDHEFQLLLALSDALTGASVDGDDFDLSVEGAPDPSRLTPTEQKLFLESLEQELDRSSS